MYSAFLPPDDDELLHLWNATFDVTSEHVPEDDSVDVGELLAFYMFQVAACVRGRA